MSLLHGASASYVVPDFGMQKWMGFDEYEVTNYIQLAAGATGGPNVTRD